VTELMKQPQFAPLSVAEMAVSLFAANQGFLDDVDNAKILSFEAALHQFMRQQHASLMEKIESSRDLDKDGEAEMASAVAAFKKTWA
jgi:F-type H+-transporting ATPase subunit alpha